MAEATDTETSSKQPKEKSKFELPHCGVIMPISGSTDYPASHWSEMLQLVREAAKEAKFSCELVSATGRDDIIHSSIVTNIYENEIIVCDVSSRNPNVMLELGLRLASKLPVVVIFDEQGNYPFDITTIRYLEYRKDMRYYDTQDFKKRLTAKLLEVHDTFKKGKYKSFLSHFTNVDFKLDTITTETQNLTQFLERIDKRLITIENQNKPFNNISDAIAPSTQQVLNVLRPYLVDFHRESDYTDDHANPEFGKKFLQSLKDKANELPSFIKVMSNRKLLEHVLEWDGLPF